MTDTCSTLRATRPANRTGYSPNDRSDCQTAGVIFHLVPGIGCRTENYLTLPTNPLGFPCIFLLSLDVP